MYDRSFFRTRLGKAALASIAATSALVILSSQIAVTGPTPTMAVYQKSAIA